MHKMGSLMAAAAAIGIGDCWQRAWDVVNGGPQCGITSNTHLDRKRRKDRARELTRKRESEIKAQKERGNLENPMCAFNDIKCLLAEAEKGEAK